MDRRTLLGSVAGAATVALAGCSGQTDTGSSDTTSTTTGDPDVTRTHLSQAADHYRDAIDAFETEAASISAVANDYGYDTSTVDEALDQADDDLAVAAENATADQEPRVERYRTYGGVIRNLTDIVDIAVAAADAYSTGMTYNDTGRYQDAYDEFRAGADDAAAALSKTQDVQTTVEQLKADADDETRLEYTSLQTSLGEMERATRGLKIFGNGAQPLAEGMQALADGRDAFEREDFADAETGFSRASQKFQTAANIFRDGENEETLVQDTIIQWTCVAERARDASQKLKSASSHAADREWTAAREAANEADSISIQSCTT